MLVNDTVCLMMTPIVLAVVRELELPPLPYLLAVATASNIGGVMTLTGNPQNMIIATAGKLSFAHYALRMAPVALGGSGARRRAAAPWMFRRELPRGPLRRPSLPPPPLDRWLLGKSLAILVVRRGRLPVGPLDAGNGAGRRRAPDADRAHRAATGLCARRLVDPPLLRRALRGHPGRGAAPGILERMFDRGSRRSSGTRAERQLVTFGLFSELASNLFSNVPYVLIAREFVPRLAQPEYQWTGLAMTSTLAGNLTIVGSVANLIVLELAGPDGQIGFFRFCDTAASSCWRRPGSGWRCCWSRCGSDSDPRPPLSQSAPRLAQTLPYPPRV